MAHKLSKTIYVENLQAKQIVGVLVNLPVEGDRHHVASGTVGATLSSLAGLAMRGGAAGASVSPSDVGGLSGGWQPLQCSIQQRDGFVGEGMGVGSAEFDRVPGGNAADTSSAY